MNKTSNHSAGFTLMELIVTMTIVVVLSGISVAIFDEYKAKANDVQALSIVKELATFSEMYLQDMRDNRIDDSQGAGAFCYLGVAHNGSNCYDTSNNLRDTMPVKIDEELVPVYGDVDYTIYLLLYLFPGNIGDTDFRYEIMVSPCKGKTSFRLDSMTDNGLVSTYQRQEDDWSNYLWFYCS